MLKGILAFGLWFALFGLALAALFATTDYQPSVAEITMEDMPVCTFFMMKTGRGFAVAEVTEPTALQVGRRVSGLSNTTGAQKVTIEGHGPTLIIVEKFNAQEDPLKLYDQYCPSGIRLSPDNVQGGAATQDRDE